MSWECYPIWDMASKGASVSSPAASEQTQEETAVAEADVVDSDTDADESAESDDEESSEITAVIKNTSKTATVEEISKENSDSIHDYEALIEAEKKRIKERLDEIAKYTHTGISVDGGCRACAYQYELNEQTQAGFAGRDVDEIEVAEEQKGGLLNQLSCIVM